VRGVAIRLLYLRSWGKLHQLLSQPRNTVRFVFGTRELDNFTYELSNEGELATFLSRTTRVPETTLEEYVQELGRDHELHQWLREALGRHDRSGRALVGRRAGWYALVRAIKPRIVLETGTHLGMGSAVLARALEKNASDGAQRGHLWTFDLTSAAGSAIPEPLRGWVTAVNGDLRDSLPRTVATLPGAIDLMIHDSDHSYDHEFFEFQVVGPHLAEGGVLLTDNGHATTALSDYSQDTGRTYSLWREIPRDHPYPGAGIGLSMSV
jgi:predicted O-methyltransferase YrrM